MKQKVFDNLAANMARFSMAPTWMNLTKMMAGAVIGGFKHKERFFLGLLVREGVVERLESTLDDSAVLLADTTESL